MEGEPSFQFLALGIAHCNLISLGGDTVPKVFHQLDSLCHGDKIGEVRVPYACGPAGSRGAGWIEGWRGEVLVNLEAGDKGLIRRCHAADPSWHNWPALEHAIMGNIVPDFPLINKSFNLSYSGVDL